MKNPGRRQANPGFLDTAEPTRNSTSTIRFSGTDNPRYLRALRALVNGPVTRKELDLIAGCSNAPDLVIGLRKLGLSKTDLCSDTLNGVDRDGRRISYGVYSLSPKARRAIRAWLRNAREAAA